MTEQEYIDATNLAKLRAAYVLVHDCVPMRNDEQGQHQAIRAALRQWIDPLERLVAIDPEKPSFQPPDAPRS